MNRSRFSLSKFLYHSFVFVTHCLSLSLFLNFKSIILRKKKNIKITKIKFLLIRSDKRLLKLHKNWTFIISISQFELF